MKKSPRTTAGGIAALVALIASAVNLMMDGDPATNPDWSVIVPAAIGFGSLIFARDQKQHEDDEEEKS